MLQNNFTTPEQSKRLLELGVPEDSADFVRFKDYSYPEILRTKYSEYIEHLTFTEQKEYTPCWSFGRLIEIIALCIHISATDIKKGYVINLLISDIERSINKIDFSKLED